ncbi:MAG: AAA family ATPase, partial [Rhizobiales bacterium]|nr:AAA family ATPase [Hyphomicrobiales bacterium]
AEARQEAAEERLEQAVQAIREELSCTPEQALAQAQMEDGAEMPTLAQIEDRLQRTRAERERLGAVNLRAEDEAAEQEGRAEELRAERDDLDKAIRRLRHGIGTLNSEARGRLVSAFDSVNEHFGKLFQTLFGGGSASLTMTDSDDPLEAGLEVIAHPPGKRPQTLTLLSGGEQALTAFALMLAVFRTNPSPICVLDEVDAPLDDHNVERFCNLVTALAEETATRFLVITHHPYTMARMDRLFGVTMAERGVSRLVSVDLDTAERFREAG